MNAAECFVYFSPVNNLTLNPDSKRAHPALRYYTPDLLMGWWGWRGASRINFRRVMVTYLRRCARRLASGPCSWARSRPNCLCVRTGLGCPRHPTGRSWSSGRNGTWGSCTRTPWSEALRCAPNNNNPLGQLYVCALPECGFQLRVGSTESTRFLSRFVPANRIEHRLAMIDCRRVGRKETPPGKKEKKFSVVGRAIAREMTNDGRSAWENISVNTFPSIEKCAGKMEKKTDRTRKEQWISLHR